MSAPSPPPASSASRAERFASLVVAHQRRVLGFIRALVPEVDAVDDLFQQTNTVLWRRFDDFQQGTNFAAWAMEVARNQVRDYRKRHLRHRGVFSDEVFDTIAEKIAAATEAADARQEALASCLRELPPDGLRVIQLRYIDGQSVGDIAVQLGRSDKTVYRLLGQLRQALMACVRKKMAKDTTKSG